MSEIGTLDNDVELEARARLRAAASTSSTAIAKYTSEEIEVARRLAFMIGEAERALGLEKPSHSHYERVTVRGKSVWVRPPEAPLDERLDRILKAAVRGRLKPQLYRLVFTLRHTRAAQKGTVADG